MLSKVYSGFNIGLNSIKIEVESEVVDRGLPSFNIVGLPSKAVDEAKERVRIAIDNSGLSFPSRSKITINLAPADVAKEGSCFDLPIALSIIIASGQLNVDKDLLEKSLFFGELSLNGDLRHTRGLFLLAYFAQKNTANTLYVPRISASQALCFNSLKVYPVSSLRELVSYLAGMIKLKPLKHLDVNDLIENSSSEFDLCQVVGQENAKRALEIAAAGGHSLFMRGPPGVGKTMLSRALPGILPVLSEAEAIEVTAIYSAAGKLNAGETLIKRRPFRSPHHTISQVGMIGGGSSILPGEVSLAHRGVLFLDEFPEFPRHVLESIRQPVEDGKVSIVRASGSVEFPSRFMLVAASNPCPCGYYNHPKRQCTCTFAQIDRYNKRISGPILDRIDLNLNLPPVEIEKLNNSQNAETSAVVRRRVERARRLQMLRYKNIDLNCNAELSGEQAKTLTNLSSAAQRLLSRSAQHYGFSARTYYKLIKVSRTIADLKASPRIEESDMAEALQFKMQ
jgi:Mg chelatase-related protein